MSSSALRERMAMELGVVLLRIRLCEAHAADYREGRLASIYRVLEGYSGVTET